METAKDIMTVSTTENGSEWSVITALDFVLNKAKGSKLCNEFWTTCQVPLEYLESTLQLTKAQIVFLAIMIESGEPISWRGFGKFLNFSRLSVMTYSEEFEELVNKGWITRTLLREMGKRFQGFALEHGVVTALRNNKPFVPQKISGLGLQEFVDRLEHHLDSYLNNINSDFEEDEEWMQRMCKANCHLQLCHEILRFDDIHILSLFMLIVYDYAQWADSNDEGLTYSTIDDTFPPDFEVNNLRRDLNNGTHPLIMSGLIEEKCEDGIAKHNRYILTARCKEELLPLYMPSRCKCPNDNIGKRFLKNFEEIKEKQMFYNAEEHAQIERLTNLLSQDSLPAVQDRLEQSGMRKGFACLFYGAPGTGKTETVLQIARQTGRNIMEVDIAGMRNKYVGESEKNIKAVFQRYREICKHSEVMPILFFNEADALINKRTENIEHSVDKMDNAMQNIILQEIENLDGILIATTNLTSNLDKAFERRFLFKVEFTKPNCGVRAKLWHSMLKDLSDEQAMFLASNYDFSGGQIENIARKNTIDFILTGSAPTMEQIEGYCKVELLDNRQRKRIGFC